jgi:hypothetical protein
LGFFERADVLVAMLHRPAELHIEWHLAPSRSAAKDPVHKNPRDPTIPIPKRVDGEEMKQGPRRLGGAAEIGPGKHLLQVLKEARQVLLQLRRREKISTASVCSRSAQLANGVLRC